MTVTYYRKVSGKHSRSQFNLYATPPHECSYLPDREAITVFVDPTIPKDANLYSSLSQHGFRRSGEYLYRPHCHSCDQCIPVRVDINAFKPRRGQRRIWNKNQDLIVSREHSIYKQEHFDLYCHYLNTRHPNGGMDNPSEESYLQFLTCRWSNTVFYEFRLQERLLAVAVTDIFEDGMSAVYTFYDPNETQRGLGVYALLWQISECRRLHFDWLYLGYWIQDSPKMRYKIDYQPLQCYRQNHWQPLKIPHL